MREMLAFDPNDPRCKHPAFGRVFDEKFRLKGLPATKVADAAGVSPEVVRAYRRGHMRPTPPTLVKLTQVLGDLSVPAENMEVMVHGQVNARRDGDSVILTMRVPLEEFRKLIEA